MTESGKGVQTSVMQRGQPRFLASSPNVRIVWASTWKGWPLGSQRMPLYPQTVRPCSTSWQRDPTSPRPSKPVLSVAIGPSRIDTGMLTRNRWGPPPTR